MCNGGDGGMSNLKREAITAVDATTMIVGPLIDPREYSLRATHTHACMSCTKILPPLAMDRIDNHLPSAHVRIIKPAHSAASGFANN